MHRGVRGAGSKGVMFCNYLHVCDDVMPSIVDLNPAKHGRFVPLTAQRAIAPDELPSIDPDHVIVMNPLYRNEIESILSGKSISAEVVEATAAVC